MKTARPTRKIRRRPKRSAALPPRRRKPAKVSVYALMTHWRFVELKCRSLWMDGSATLTIDASSTTMNWPTQTSASTSQEGTERPSSSSIVMPCPW